MYSLAREFISLFFSCVLRQTDMFIEIESEGFEDYQTDSSKVRMGNIWFNRASSATAKDFHAVGRALGLALFNACLCSLTLPGILFRRLLGWPCGLDDLGMMKPALARGLKELLNYEPRDDLEKVFGLDFTATVPSKTGQGADVVTLPLVQRASQPPDVPVESVTGANVERYVQAMVFFHTGGAVIQFLTAFRRGFLEVCGGPFMDTLVPEEVISPYIFILPSCKYVNLKIFFH